jgi:hypothetical protein
MDSVRPTLNSKSSPKQPIVARRSFIWKTGAALSAMLASAVAGVSKPRADGSRNLKEQVDRLSNQLGILEDTNAIRKLHQAYGYYLDKGIYEEIVNLFADDGEVYFNGGIFVGKDRGVRRLYIDHFGQGFAGKNGEPVHGFLLDHTQQQDVVNVAPDRKSAKARFHCFMQAWVRDPSEYPMMELARQQGQGILQWWEGGVYENLYLKDGDSWKIKKLDYRAIWQADYALGWSYAKPGYVPPFSKTYPEDPTGPDKLITPAPELRADTEVMAFRYPHPVTGKLWQA